MQKTIFKDLKLIDYKKAWDYQEKIFAETVEQKIDNRKNNTTLPTKNYLLFCEHPHVYTLGRNGNENNLLLDYIQLQAKDAAFYKINRGGDITYHGPGQLVGYPILDLDNFFTDVRKYIFSIEEAIIRTMQDFSIVCTRLKGASGVWVEPNTPKARKICAIGVRISRWVTMHGWALNVNSDLSYFNHINPCGFTDKGVTSMQKELGKKIDFDTVKQLLKNHFENIFETKLTTE